MYINISYDSLRYGVNIGFKLSRLEWIWGSPYEVIQKEFEPSKSEILTQLPLENMYINELDYKSFSQSILGYYLRTDITVYSSILIGITIQRCALIGVSKHSEVNNELLSLAKSALRSIPGKIVSDKEYLFKAIYERRDKDYLKYWII